MVRFRVTVAPWVCRVTGALLLLLAGLSSAVTV
jgi:hypothetical protein